MMQPFAAFTLCFSIVASVCVRILIVSRYLYLTKSFLGENGRIEMKSASQLSLSFSQLTSNPIRESVSETESGVAERAASIQTKQHTTGSVDTPLPILSQIGKVDQDDLSNLPLEDRIAVIQVASTTSVLVAQYRPTTDPVITQY